MIIEDNEVHNLLLCHSVEDMQHTHAEFFGIEKAKADLIENKPDLIIIDVEIQESRKASLDLLDELHKMKDYRDIPTIVISAVVSKEDILKQLPFLDSRYVIEKPFNIETITSKIRELLKNNE